MDTKLIARLVDLVRKTGDRVVVPDDMENGRAVVIMDLDAYEELMGIAMKEEPVSAKTVESPLQRMFGQEPLSVPENDVVQQIRAIRKEPDASSFQLPASSPDSRVESAPPDNLPVAERKDLTAPKNDANIKREIGDWKTVGDVRQSVDQPRRETNFGPAKQPVNQPAVQTAPAVADQMEDEERFYLEPIE